jgi:hypothetical protein
MEGFVDSGEFESFDLACAGLKAFRSLESAKPLRRSQTAGLSAKDRSTRWFPRSSAIMAMTLGRTAWAFPEKNGGNGGDEQEEALLKRPESGTEASGLYALPYSSR